jgi:16S rRNA (guanine1516-N2)-methyltransferase
MVERDPIVAALLRDGIRRLEVLSNAPGLDSRADRAAELSKKLHLHGGDSTKVLKDLLSSGIHPHPDIVYLDPMFPPRKKSAKVKKGMTILHSLLDTQSSDTASEDKRLQDELLLLGESIKAAKRKVVVKRPAKAVPLGGEMSPFRASYAIEGSVNRWDIYVK